MLTLNELNNHFSLTTSQIVQEICKPLFSQLGFEYFTFHRIYSDATTIRLSTYPEWSHHCIMKDYVSNFSEDHYFCTASKYKYIIWEEYLNGAALKIKSKPMIKEALECFSINHGFTIWRKFENYCDSFNFGYLNIRKNFNYNDHLSKIEYMENFAHYFIQKADKLILDAFHTRLDIHYSHENILKNQISKVSFPIDLKSFSINDAQYHLSTKLTAREKQCLMYLKQGLTAKKTALILGLNYRTIEAYLDNIRNKTGIRKNTDLANLIL